MTKLSRFGLSGMALSIVAGIACGDSRAIGDRGGGGRGSGAGGFNSGTGGRAAGGGSGVGPGGVVVDPSTPEERRAAYTAAKAELAQDRPAGASEFLARWRPSYLQTLPYDPTAAVNLSTVQASTLKLNEPELAILRQRGFAVSARQQFGTYFQGYLAIYASHLPLFVSADSVLHAVHRSYDKILLDIENQILIKALSDLLAAMHSGLPAAKTSGAWPAETVADVDEYVTVARRLLGTGATPVAGGNAAMVASLVARAQAAGGLETVSLFGADRGVDFSQFTPRGHYAGAPSLENYFRSTMWLGRTDMRLVTEDAPGKVTFQRRQFAAALLMAHLVGPSNANWKMLDETLRAFVGESDNMLPADFETLRRNLGVASLPETLTKGDQELAQAVIDGGFGIQRIASQILYVDPNHEGAPLDRAFLLLGQRFVIDSQVLSNVVYDRVQSAPYRLMPSPLDVAFAALGNARAVDLLQADLNMHPDYPAALHDARKLVDKHEPSYWQQSLYGSWLAALRAASPPADTTNPAAVGLPAVAATEAWARRILQMQMASWTELRHDTLLYAKQSYTGIPACEFPDAYVEPAPALWQALTDLGKRGEALALSLRLADSGLPAAGSYFASLAATTSMLKDMADRQVAGQPFTGDQMAFINQAVELKTVSIGSGSAQLPAGWYPNLFYDREAPHKQDTIVADVHTQPADSGGNIVGKVLHVATGYPRLMVTTFETCSGPRAYAGLVSNYYETTTEGFDRLTDQRWTAGLSAVPAPAPIPWMNDLVGR